jgi:hypothetical protein
MPLKLKNSAFGIPAGKVPDQDKDRSKVQTDNADVFIGEGPAILILTDKALCSHAERGNEICEHLEYKIRFAGASVA